MGMDMNINTTIVTALFDIGRDNWKNFTMSYHTYLHWMHNTLSIDCNMVIYTEEKFKDEIYTHRKLYDSNLQKTKIIVIPLEELSAYKVYAKPLQELMYSEEFKKKASFDVPEMNQYLYNVIMFGKLHFLKDTYDNNYFPGQELLVWADAAGLRDDIKDYANIVWPESSRIDKDKITFFSHHSNISILVEADHALSQMRFIQGTCFIVPVHLVNALAKDFEALVFECLGKGYIGSDEKILDFYYLRHPELCTLIKCTWREYYNILKPCAP